LSNVLLRRRRDDSSVELLLAHLFVRVLAEASERSAELGSVDRPIAILVEHLECIVQLLEFVFR